MDKREAIRKFVRQNSAMLKMDPFPQDLYKKAKHSFFVEQAKVGNPKDSEIAGEILEILIKSSQIKNESELESYFNMPFFKEKLLNKEYYSQKLSIENSGQEPILTSDTIREADYVDRYAELLKNKAVAEATKEKEEKIAYLDEKIKDKSEAYLSMPSIVDGKEYPIPEIEDHVEESGKKEDYLPWWDKLGLVGEPFHELEGLDKIDREVWEVIVHKTEIFNRYEQIIEKTPDELFRNTVWYGTFGSGKTTFFDYIQPKLYQHKIYPIYIQLGGEYEIRELVFELKRRLKSELQDLNRIIAGYGTQSIDALDDQQAIVELLKCLMEHKAKGFIVFIDDLHKGDTEKAMKFMSHLQVIRSQISRDSPKNLNFVFYIAGIPEWQTKMTGDDRFLSSVSHEEYLPPLKLEMAVDVINRRLKAFAKNLDNPRKLPTKYVERIYKKIQYSGKEVTFRRLLHEIRKELALEHFSAFEIDPVNIPVATIGEIKSLLEKNLILRGKLYKLLYSKGLKSAQKRFCFGLLIDLYIKNGLQEEDIRESDVAFLQQLSHAGLIVKVNVENRLIWKVSQDLLFFNKQIIEQYNLSFEDYLPKLYYGEVPETKKKIKLFGPEIEYLDALIQTMKEGLTKDLLSQARVLHVDIVETGDKYLNSEMEMDKIVNKCAQSLARLTKAYLSFEDLDIDAGKKDIELLNFWKEFWKSPEVLQQFVRAYAPEAQDAKRSSVHIVSLYREAFPQVFGFFKEEYEGSRQFRIPISHLKNTEIELFHKSRELWMEGKYQELTERLSSYVERKLRTFLHNIYTIYYGAFEERVKWIDPDSRKYIYKNWQNEKSRGWRSSQNEFVQLNRAQYKNLMTGDHGSVIGRRNWQQIFCKIFRQWTEKDLSAYLDMFAEVNIKASHNKDSLDICDQNFIYEFILRSMRFIIDMNQSYVRLLSIEAQRYRPPNHIYLSLNGVQDQTVNPVVITKEDIVPVKEGFLAKDRVKIPLEDQEYTEGIIGLNYRKAYALLAFLVNQSEKMLKTTKTKIDITQSRGSEIYLKLTEL